MSKIYDAQGNKMNTQQILGELSNQHYTIICDQLGKSLTNSSNITIKNDQSRLAHAILDCYKDIDGATEQGMRARKLLDNLMTKYQKSTGSIGQDDQSAYHSFICDILREV